MKTIIAIQARMSSTRLPEKILEKIGDLTALEHVVARCAMAGVETWVLAPYEDAEALVTQDEMPLPSVKIFGSMSVKESDVLGRYAAFAFAQRLQPDDIIVRITADCPFIQPADIVKVAGYVAATSWTQCAWACNTHWVPDGHDVEAFHVRALMLANSITKDAEGREHFAARALPSKPARIDCGTEKLRHHRWTLDTPEDLAWFRAVAKHIDVTPPHPTTAELLALIDERPELLRTREMYVAEHTIDPARMAT